MARKKTRKPRKQNDELLKSAFEENFVDFLRFIYPNADEIFDFSRGITFMDKELLLIIPNRDRRKGRRNADLLARVYLKNGGEKWILVHTEIEGGRGGRAATSPFRMFQYNYRLSDHYQVLVETIVVYTGDQKQPRPSEYYSQAITTQIHFQYRTYHILDHSEAELLAMDNIFALIVLACQKALLEDKLPEEELGSDRLTIAKALLRQQYDKDRIHNFLVFLKNMLYIHDPEINRTFDQEIIQLSGGNIDMSVIDIVKKQERELGVQEGLQQGLSEGLQQGLSEGLQQGLSEGLQQGLQRGRLEERARAEAEKREIAREMKKDGLPLEQIAKFTRLSMQDIEML